MEQLSSIISVVKEAYVTYQKAHAPFAATLRRSCAERGVAQPVIDLLMAMAEQSPVATLQWAERAEYEQPVSSRIVCEYCHYETATLRVTVPLLNRDGSRERLLCATCIETCQRGGILFGRVAELPH